VRRVALLKRLIVLEHRVVDHRAGVHDLNDLRNHHCVVVRRPVPLPAGPSHISPLHRPRTDLDSAHALAPLLPPVLSGHAASFTPY
jgi:hypothetical protein